MRYLLLILFAFLSLNNFAQKLSKAQKKAEKKALKLQEASNKLMLVSYKAAVEYLASDALDGRRTGTSGADAALQFISDKFTATGLEPKGTSGFLQELIINEGLIPSQKAQCIIGGKTLSIFTDWLPLNISALGSIKEYPTLTMREYGMPWCVDLKKFYDDNKTNPHFDIYAAIITFTKDALKNGCKGLILYNTDSTKNNEISYSQKEKPARLSIPIIYIKYDAYKTYLKNEKSIFQLNCTINFEEQLRYAKNAIGFINNNVANTIVIGAHYDHLGHGEDKNSRYTGTDSAIHNGADDNASGTAGLIELAKILKASSYKNNNYLFIAFSGEELGLYGSKYFTENPTIDFGSINYMINMDMIGRLSDTSKALTIGGFGTSPTWASVINTKNDKHLNLKFDSSGTGPSDHSSFYRKNIPVLFFFTGLHTDYHMPSDDADKINYNGAIQVLNKIEEIIKNTDPLGKLPFLKTREQQMGNNTRFKVTLGIMPDYAFGGAGVKADGVSDGKPAKIAGILTGDIVTQIGDTKISGMDSYMKALGEHTKGDKVEVLVLRAGKVLKFNVVF